MRSLVQEERPGSPVGLSGSLVPQTGRATETGG